MIKIPRGIRIGSAEDAYTGVTVILSENGCVGGVSVRGNAPGTRETDLFAPEKKVDAINAVVLAGGSAYGLNACGGVMEFCREKNIGFKMGKKVVPIVAGAVIYDLNDAEYHYPDAKMGYDACVNAFSNNTVPLGQLGIGRGATVGKIRGMKNASKGGVGAHTVSVAGLCVTAIVVVNAFGDVVDPANGEIIAGAKGKNGFIDTNKCLLENKLLTLVTGSNTTIGCIITNAKLDKTGANKLASIGHNGLARTIRPVHTDYDGDTLFCLSTNKIPVINFAVLQAAAVEAVEKAVINAVKESRNLEVAFCDEENVSN